MSTDCVQRTTPARRQQQLQMRSAVTAAVDGGLVVFLIGMRINTWWRPDLWLPVIWSMRRMLRELRAHPECGMVGLTPTGWSNPVVLVQYWRSAEHLQRFASSPALPHRAAWTEFYGRVSATHAVGIWHETFVVPPGGHESIYVNMPAFGLGAAFGTRPATGPHATATGRLRLDAARVEKRLARATGKQSLAAAGMER